MGCVPRGARTRCFCHHQGGRLPAVSIAAGGGRNRASAPHRSTHPPGSSSALCSISSKMLNPTLQSWRARSKSRRRSGNAGSNLLLLSPSDRPALQHRCHITNQPGIASTSPGERLGEKRQALVHPVVDTGVVVGELLVAMRNAELVQPPHKPAGAVEQIELIIPAAVDVERL